MDTSLLDSIVRAVGPWADTYGDSTFLQTGILFAHFAGLLTAGGFAVASDRLVLRATRNDGPSGDVALREIHAVHRPVLVGLAVVTATGVAMALADAAYLLVSPVFWLKMAAFVALLINGLFMVRAERRLRAPARPARRRRFRAHLPSPFFVAPLAGAGVQFDPVRFTEADGPGRPWVLVSTEGAEAPEPDDGPIETPDAVVAPFEPNAASESDPEAWRLLRRASLRSMALWGLTLLLGTVLTAV